ncbi:hypothetical protein IFM89_013656 [Coptis chinensis]|uniref:Uncharacterized protein n=1 Tax=Coptis chinensis TaxID=261450 RepID=A0A835IKH0_9MAGN|nr:hypothetical protein IFM89_013656 [Coptis chinensis]
MWTLDQDFARLKGDGGIISAWGLQRLLENVKLKYKNLAAIIYENGFPMTADDLSNPASRNDTGRIKYLQSALKSLYPSVSTGQNNKLPKTKDDQDQFLAPSNGFYELLGITASFFWSPTSNVEAQDRVLELDGDRSYIADCAQVMENIKEDFERSYFITGIFLQFQEILYLMLMKKAMNLLIWRHPSKDFVDLQKSVPSLDP